MRFKYFATAIAAITLAGCSNNDDVPAGNNQPDANKAQAYLKVKINQTGGSGVSRGSVPTNNEFEQATADEYNISNAKFYFYDANGDYVMDGKEIQNIPGNEDNDANSALDFKSEVVIALEKVTGMGFPKYMVTILNAQDNFNAENKSLKDLEKMLALASGEQTEDGKVWDETTTGNNNFIMTTSSYLENENRTAANKNYFVTEIKETNYKSSKDDAKNDKNAVQIYVERLAAKVSLGLEDNLTNTSKLENGTTIYKLDNVTISGKNNSTGNDQELYAKIIGWGLTNTAKNSYMMMNLNDSWTFNSPFTNWQANTQYRSYWGMSYLYDATYVTDKLIRNTYAGSNSQVGHPTTGKETKDEKETTVLQSGVFNYCAENTLKSLNENNLLTDATSVLLTAELVDENGTPQSYIRYNGLLWTYESFVDYMFSKVKVYKAVNTEDNKTEYVSLSLVDRQKGDNSNGYWKFVKTADNSQGAVKIELVTTNNKFYKKGDKSYEELKANDISSINTELSNLVSNNNNNNNNAIAYENGMMYYAIPIEHLNTTASGTNYSEGQYGVVRNHYYKLTLTALQGIGNGVFDKDEPIIPQPKPDYYYVGAQINVLSWHVVEQDVEL